MRDLDEGLRCLGVRVIQAEEWLQDIAREGGADQQVCCRHALCGECRGERGGRGWISRGVLRS